MRIVVVARVNRSKSFVGFKCCVRECPLLGAVLDYILDSLLISSYLLLPSTFNLQPYFKLNINRILSKGYFNSVFIVSGKYEFKMGLEIEGCSSSKSQVAQIPSAPL